jgi:hypothetical protein
MCHSCGIVNRRAPDGSEPRPLVTKSIGVQVELAAAVTVIEAPFSSVSVTASSSRAVAPEKDQTRGALKADNAARQSSSQSVTASAADQTTQLVVESTNISNNGNDHSVSTAIRDADPGLPCTLSAPQPAVNGYGTSMTSMDAGVQTSVKSESLYFRVPEVNLFSDQHLFDLGNAQLDGSKSFQPVDDLTAAQHSVRHFSENPRSARSSARVSSAASRRGASASSTARPDEAPAGSVGIDFGFRPIGDDDDVTWMVSETAGGDTSSAPHSRVMSAMARRLSAAGGRGGIGGAGEAVVSLPQRHPAVSGSAGVTAASSMLGGALVALPGADSSNPPPGSIAGNHFSARAALVVPPGSNIRFHRASSGGSKRAGAPSTSPAPQEAPKCSRALVEASRYATSSGANDEKHPQQLSAPPASYRHRFPAHSPVTASSGNAIIIDATSSGATIAGGHSTSAPQASQEQVIPVAYIHGAFVETFGCTPSALLHSNRSIKDLAAKASRVHSAAPSRSGKGTHVAPQGSFHREQQQQQQLLPPRASSATLVRDPVHR